MPARHARSMAQNSKVTAEELAAMIACMDKTIKSKRENNEPIPLVTIRNRQICAMALKFRKKGALA